VASLKKWLDQRRNPWKSVFYDAIKRWRRENGPKRLYSYDTLTADSVAFDFGGFKGEWADRILATRCGMCHIFEPHPRFAGELDQKYADQPRAQSHAFALGSSDGTLNLSDSGDSSSAVAAHDRSLSGEIRSVKRFFAENDVPRIDLVKINIEGGEYDLLPALAEAGILPRIQRLQVQFHLFSPELMAERDAIRATLAKTHTCVWEYPFVWEEWHRKS